MAESAGGAGFNFSSNATDGFGLGQIASNLSDSVFCGFDKECRRGKNKPAEAPDIYNITFGGNSNGSNIALIGLLAVLLIVAVVIYKQQ